MKENDEGKIMKQNAISKISRMGEIGGYLTIIARIFVILAFCLSFK